MSKLTTKQQHWSTIIKDWRASNLSQAEFCRQNNINLKRFYTWKHSIEKKISSSNNSAKQAGRFLPVAIPENHVDTSIAVSVSGIEICFDQNTDQQLFLQCVRLLKEAS